MSILQSCLPASLNGATPTNCMQIPQLVLQQAASVVSLALLHVAMLIYQYQGMFKFVSTHKTILDLSKLMSSANIKACTALSQDVKIV